MFWKSTEKIKEQLEQQFHPSVDIEYRELKNGQKDIQILYIKSICDDKSIHKYIIDPFFIAEELSDYENYLLSQPGCTRFSSEEQTIQLLLQANIAIFTPRHVFLFNANKVVDSTIGQVTTETTVQGPQLGLSEDLDTSLNLLRHRYPTSALKVEQIIIGSSTKTQVAILYDEDLVEQDVLHDVKRDLQAIKIDVLQAAGQLHNLLNKRKRTLFPTMLISERPDRVILNIAQGKVVMLMNGTRFALVVPAVFYDFFTAMDDLYQSYWVSKFLLALRYIGLMISVTVPAFYVAITSFNPELLRVQLTVSIAGSRAAVPYPSYLEVVFMLGMMELLTEASIRLPKYIGSTATTVGGLILGQAAQQAGLVSSIMIIVVAAVAISNFVIPINAMSFAIRVLKYLLVILATFFGIIGVAVGILLIIVHLADIRSYGKPYFKLFIGEKKKADRNQKEEKG